MAKLNPDDVRFDHPNADGEFTHYQFHDAVEAQLELSYPHLPATIEVTTYGRCSTLPSHWADRLLENAVESMDEHFHSEEPTEVTPWMRASAEVFARVLAAEYVPWVMEPRATATVDVNRWVRDNWTPDDQRRYIVERE